MDSITEWFRLDVSKFGNLQPGILDLAKYAYEQTGRELAAVEDRKSVEIQISCTSSQAYTSYVAIAEGLIGHWGQRMVCVSLHVARQDRCT